MEGEGTLLVVGLTLGVIFAVVVTVGILWSNAIIRSAAEAEEDPSIEEDEL